MNLVKAAALMVLGTRATLTTGGTVTGSSFENNSRVPSALVAGKFGNKNGCTDCGGCVFTKKEPNSWLNIQLLHYAAVYTVVIINREDGPDIASLAGSVLTVGYDPNPMNNAHCANVDKSGVYQCNGLKGNFVGVFNSNGAANTQVQLCQVRAYPWLANATLQSVTDYDPISGFPPENALSFNDDEALDLAWRNNAVVQSRWRFIHTDSFVYAVVLVGDPTSDFAYSQDWYVTAGFGAATSNQSFGGYLTKADRFGMELIIKAQSSKVSFIRSNNTNKFGFIFAGIFAASSDCSQTLTFNYSQTGIWPPVYNLKAVPVANTISLDPKNPPECPVVTQVTLSNGAALPSFMTFYPVTLIMTVKPLTIAHVGTFNIKVVASYFDGVSPFVANTYTFTITVQCATSITLSSAPIPDQTYTLTQPALLIPLPTYSYIPSTTETKFVFTLVGAPSFVTINGANIQIVTSANVDQGDRNITVLATETISGLTNQTQFALKVICLVSLAPSASQPNVIYQVNTLYLEVFLPLYIQTPNCNLPLTYSVTQSDMSPLPSTILFDANAGSPELIISSNNLSAAPQYNIVVKVTEPLSGKTNSSIAFTVTFYCNQSIVFDTAAITNFTYIIDAAATLMQIQSPMYKGAPLQCPSAVTYTLLLESTDVPVASTPFVTLNQTFLTLSTSNTSFVGIYNFRITATDTVSGKTDTTVSFKATLVCRPTSIALTSGAISTQNYIINAAALTLTVPTYSTLPLICTQDQDYTMLLIDSTSGLTPVFLSPAQPTAMFQIFSNDYQQSEKTYQITLRASLNYNLLLKTESNFQVNVLCVIQSIDVLSPLTQTSFTFMIDPIAGTPLDIALPTYQASPNPCNYANFVIDLVPFSAFITVGSIIRISTTDLTKAGSYQFTVQATETNTGLENTDLTFTVLLTCATASVTLVSAPILDFSYQIQLGPLQETDILMPNYLITPACCIPYISFALTNIDGLLTSWIGPMVPTQGQVIKVGTQDFSQVGLYNFKLEVINFNGVAVNSMSFKTTLFCQTTSINLISGGTIDQVNRKVSTSPNLIQYTIVPVPVYLAVPVGCPVTVILELLDFSNKLKPLPSFIMLDSTTMEIRIGTSDQSLVGPYKFIIQAKESSGILNEEVVLQVNIQGLELKIDSNPIDDVSYLIEIDQSSPPINIFVPQYGNANSQSMLVYELILITFVPKNPVPLRLLQASFPNFITQYPTSIITISTNDPSQAGVYYFKLVATDVFSNTMNDDIKFTVTLTCSIKSIKPIYDSKTITEVSFIIKKDDKNFNLPQYEVTPQGCTTSGVDFQIVSLDGTPLPSFISLNAQNTQVCLKGGSFSEGRINFGFKVIATTDGNISNDSYTFVVKTQIDNKPPYFSQPLQSYNITLGENYNNTFTLPQVLDQEKDTLASLKVNMGTIRSWVSSDIDQQNNIVFSINSALLDESQVGTHLVNVVLTDSAGSSGSYNFNMIVNNPVISTQDEPDLPSVINTLDPNEMPMNVWDGYNKTSEKNPGNKIIIPPLIASISEVSLFGVFKIKFQENIRTGVFPYGMIESIKKKDLLDVSIEWKNPEYNSTDVSKPIYTWVVKNTTNSSFIEFQLVFDDPLQVSQFKKQDVVVVKIKKRQFFRRQTDNEALSSLFFFSPIPKQAPSEKEALKITQTLGQFQGISGSTYFVLLFYLVMNLPKSMFWSLHATIQFICYEPTNGGSFPANVIYFQQLIQKLSNMNFETVDKYIKKVFNPITASRTRMLQTAAGNYSQALNSTDQVISHNALVDAGIYVLAIVIFGAAIGILSPLKLLLVKCECGRYVDRMMMQEIRRTLMFSSVIRMAQLGYMIMVVKSVSAIFGSSQINLIKNANQSKIVNTLIYYTLFSFIILYPIGVTIFLMIQGPNGLKKEAVIEKFRSFFLSVDTKRRLNLMVTVNFLLRRAIVGTSIALLNDFYNLQMIICLVTSLLSLLFTVHAMPMLENMNKVEIMNECFLMMTIYLMHLFCDFVPEESIRFRIGWYYIYLVFTVFAANMLLIGGQSFLEVVGMWKQYWARRALKKKIAKLLQQRFKKKDANKNVKKQQKGRKNTNGLLESVKEDPLEDFLSSESASIEEEEKNNSSFLPISQQASKKNSFEDFEVNSEEFQCDQGSKFKVERTENQLLETDRPLLLSSERFYDNRDPVFESPLAYNQKQYAYHQNQNANDSSLNSGFDQKRQNQEPIQYVMEEDFDVYPIRDTTGTQGFNGSSSYVGSKQSMINKFSRPGSLIEPNIVVENSAEIEEDLARIKIEASEYQGASSKQIRIDNEGSLISEKNSSFGIELRMDVDQKQQSNSFYENLIFQDNQLNFLDKQIRRNTVEHLRENGIRNNKIIAMPPKLNYNGNEPGENSAHPEWTQPKNTSCGLYNESDYQLHNHQASKSGSKCSTSKQVSSKQSIKKLSNLVRQMSTVMDEIKEFVKIDSFPLQPPMDMTKVQRQFSQKNITLAQPDNFLKQKKPQRLFSIPQMTSDQRAAYVNSQEHQKEDFFGVENDKINFTNKVLQQSTESEVSRNIVNIYNVEKKSDYEEEKFEKVLQQFETLHEDYEDRRENIKSQTERGPNMKIIQERESQRSSSVVTPFSVDYRKISLVKSVENTPKQNDESSRFCDYLENLNSQKMTPKSKSRFEINQTQAPTANPMSKLASVRFSLNQDQQNLSDFRLQTNSNIALNSQPSQHNIQFNLNSRRRSIEQTISPEGSKEGSQKFITDKTERRKILAHQGSLVLKMKQEMSLERSNKKHLSRRNSTGSRASQ